MLPRPRPPVAIPLAVLIAAAGVVPSSATELTAEVAVEDNFFDPEELRVDPAASDTVTVTWSWQGGNTHTVTADDGTWGSGQQSTGTFRHTFTEPGTYAYYCQIHGRGAMSGVVQIGPPPAPEPVASSYVYVPSDGITLEQAAARAVDGTTIVLEPGHHVVRDPVRLSRPGVTVRGGERPGTTGAEPGSVSPEAVVVSSLGAAPYAFEIDANADDPSAGVLVRDLTISRFRLGAILLQDARHHELRGLRLVHPEGNWDHGILSVGSRYGRIEDVVVTGARFAGISLRRSSDVVVHGVTVTDSFVGLEQVGPGTGLRLWASTFRDNANGIVLQVDLDAPGTSATAADVRGNTVVANANRETPRPPFSVYEELQPGAGAGIWLAGARHAGVSGNTVSSNRYGVVVTARGDTGDGNRVRDNLLDANGTDLGWDGAGVNTCFAGNRSALGGSEPTSSPPAVQTLYPCSRPTVGLPNPWIDADLALAAMQAYYCQLEPGLCQP